MQSLFCLPRAFLPSGDTGETGDKEALLLRRGEYFPPSVTLDLLLGDWPPSATLSLRGDVEPVTELRLALMLGRRPPLEPLRIKAE